MYNENMLELVNANYGEGYWMGSHHGPFSWIVLVLLVLAVVMIIARIWRGGTRRAGDGALDILGQRFANGEIDENEYRERRNVLKSRR